MYKDADRDRFWKHVNAPKDLNTKQCWLWTGAPSGKDGKYAQTRMGARKEYVHRVAYEMFYNVQIPSDQLVMHKCDVTLCVNPHHLTLGSQSDNMIDCSSKNRLNVTLSPDNVRYIIRQMINGVRPVELAKQFGVQRGTISHIRSGTNWSWILNEFTDTELEQMRRL